MKSVEPSFPQIGATLVETGSPDFFEIADKLLELAEDLKSVSDRRHLLKLDPCAALSNWEMAAHLVPHLVGDVTDHPILGKRRISTSQLYFIDTEIGLARTLSRWYRLSSPVSLQLPIARH